MSKDIADKTSRAPAYVDAVPRLMLMGWHQSIGGADGLGCWDNYTLRMRVIESTAVELDGNVWSHVSVSRQDRKLPTWEQTRDVFWLIHPDRAGVIVVAPSDRHVNIAEVMHVWCNLTADTVPDFTRGGTSI